LAAALQFAVVHPIDDYGVVKGAYLMFAAPVAFALFGLAVDWGHRKRVRLPVAGALWGSLLVLAWYSVSARLTTNFPWEAAAIAERKAIDSAFVKGGL
jgi:hypothetical protein